MILNDVPRALLLTLVVKAMNKNTVGIKHDKMGQNGLNLRSSKADAFAEMDWGFETLCGRTLCAWN